MPLHDSGVRSLKCDLVQQVLVPVVQVFRQRPESVIAVRFVPGIDQTFPRECNLVLEDGRDPLGNSLVPRSRLAATDSALIKMLDYILTSSERSVHSRHRQPSFLLRLGLISNPRHSISRSTESRLIPHLPRVNLLNCILKSFQRHSGSRPAEQVTMRGGPSLA